MISSDDARPVIDAIMHCRLRLAPNVRFDVQEHRGQVSAIIHEPTQNVYFKASMAIKTLLLQLDGSKSLHQLAKEHESLAATACSEQAFDIILQLLEAKVLLSDLPATIDWDLKRREQLAQSARRARWLKPWLLKVPLLNPDRLLNRLNAVLGGFWTVPVFLIWLTVVSFAVAVAAANWQSLTGYWQTRFLDPSNLVLMAIVYPLLKTIHELAHGLTTKKWGGHVYEMGILFLFFMPVPYVDASASVNLRSKYQRMAVAASGVMAELLCASFALFIWLISESILVRDIAVNVMLIGAVSSVFFNGNPLLKFDGYYVLSDWLEIPNLSARSNAYIATRVKSRLFGLPVKVPRAHAGERKWLLSYAALSGVYRFLVTITIALFIANHYFFIGSALALLAIGSQIVWPVIKAIHGTWQQVRTHRRHFRFCGVLMGISALLWLLLFGLPLPQTTSATGLLLTAPENQIKAETSGFLTDLYSGNGDAVQAGDVLLGLSNAPLLSEIRYLEARVAEVETLFNQFISTDPVQAAIYRDELTTFAQELKDLLEQRQGLQVRASATGVLRMADNGQQPGRYIEKGQVIATIENDRAQLAYAMVAESASAAMMGPIQQVLVKLKPYPELTLIGSLANKRAETTRELPTRFLGTRFGGEIPVSSADPAGTQSLQSLLQYQIEVALPATVRIHEARVEVRFVHHSQPVGERLWRWLRQYVLRNLQV